ATRGWVEARAGAILEGVPDYIWNGEELPVPVEKIVSNTFGLLIREVEDMTEAPGLEEERSTNVSGLLLTGPGEIWVNAAEARQWEGRKRFTICHELGHYVIHQDSLEPTVFCRRIEVVDEGEPGPGDDPRAELEREADAFAAALLMPAALVAERRAALDDDLAALCAEFGASEKAMRYRLQAVPVTER
ncbi:MAG: ImmA/IrrE family metallo-endopeptidase, partial [Solirubrobacterales bacterium]